MFSALLSDRRGAAAVEFALVLPLLMMLVFGAVEFGRMFWIKNSIQFAVEEAGRFAMVNTDATTGELEAYAESRIFGMDPTDITFSVTAESFGGTDFMSIAGTYEFVTLIPLVPIDPIDLDAKSRVPLVN